MEVLVCLAQNAGKPVSKEQFMSSVWAGTVVTDDVLSRCISELRKIFGDSPKKSRYIETIRKRGYRLVQPVEFPAPVAEAVPDVEPVEVVEETREERSTRLWNDVKKEIGQRLGEVWANKTNPWVWGSALGVLAVLAILFSFLNRALFTEQIAEAPPKTVPFTSFPGEELDPALDPSAERVAFSWNGGEESFDIYCQADWRRDAPAADK